MTNLSSENCDLIIIAEIGVNHEGVLVQAQKMIELVSTTGVQIVKFQSYTPERYASASDSGRLERVRKFSLGLEDFQELATFAKERGLEFLSTPLSEDWVEKLNPFVEAFKIASGDITFKPVIENAAKTGKPLIISTGAATIEEIDQAVSWVREIVGNDNLYDRLILMHCVAAYPVPIDQANLLSIPFLKDRYKLRIGYSNHVIGMDACLAAVALGADIIEVHFTDQKEGREFRDHSLSFDEKDLKEFVVKAKSIRSALGIYGKKVQQCENEMIPMIRKGIIASRDIEAGHVLIADDLMYARPATEFKAMEIDILIGKQIKGTIKKGHLIPRDLV